MDFLEGHAQPGEGLLLANLLQRPLYCALEVSPDARPGPHSLEVGMYLLATVERLPVQDSDSGAERGDPVVLGAVEVVP